MFDGLPNLFGQVIGMASRAQQHGSLKVMAYHLLGDIANAAEHALIHYFPLSLKEWFLQNSSLGTPYQKWAKFTNDDFRRLDRCIQRLIPTAWACYLSVEEPCNATIKDAGHWFDTVPEAYKRCYIDTDKPTVTLSALHLDGWVETIGGQSRNIYNRPYWDHAEPIPPILTASVYDIADRRRIVDLKRAGIARLEEMRSWNNRFAEWIRSHSTIEEIIAPHRGTLSDYSLG